VFGIKNLDNLGALDGMCLICNELTLCDNENSLFDCIMCNNVYHKLCINNINAKDANCLLCVFKAKRFV
jgi:hypothetical protein